MMTAFQNLLPPNPIASNAASALGLPMHSARPGWSFELIRLRNSVALHIQNTASRCVETGMHRRSDELALVGLLFLVAAHESRMQRPPTDAAGIVGTTVPEM